MNGHEKTRNAASAALVALRSELNMTQAQFAVTEMKTAVSTIARWETATPPREDALIEIAKIADREARNETRSDDQRRRFEDLASTFRGQYLLDAAAAIPEDQFDRLSWLPAAAPDIGFLLLRLKNMDEYNAADSFLSAITALRWPKNAKQKKSAAAALKALSEAADEFSEEKTTI